MLTLAGDRFYEEEFNLGQFSISDEFYWDFPEITRKLIKARTQSVGQHHDGITGTNAQFVNDDYLWEYYKVSKL